MTPRRRFLALAAGLALPRLALAADPRERPIARRLELWARAAADTRLLIARYESTRQSALLPDPLRAAGTLLARAPDLLLLRDDGRAGATTHLGGGQIEIRPNDPELPALVDSQAPAITWLFEHMRTLFALPAGVDPAALLLADAQVSIPRGAGLRLDLSPPRDHPARAKIRDLIVQLDPHTGDVDQLQILEASGDRVELLFSERRRAATDDELAGLLDPPGRPA